MIKEQDIIADLHIHTIGSMHGYSTLKECIESAEKCGMKYIAITDHYYNDGTELDKKNEISRFRFLEKSTKSSASNICIIGGAEFNIGQEVDAWDELKNLKWKLIGVHGWFLNREATTLDDLYKFF